MKEQKTAKLILSNHYDVDNRGDEAAIVYAMQEYSDQQNAELRERVKELLSQLTKYREALERITEESWSFERHHKIAKEALKQEDTK